MRQTNSHAAPEKRHAGVLNLFSHGSRRPSLRTVALAERPQRSWPTPVGQDCCRCTPHRHLAEQLAVALRSSAFKVKRAW